MASVAHDAPVLRQRGLGGLTFDFAQTPILRARKDSWLRSGLSALLPLRTELTSDELAIAAEAQSDLHFPLRLPARIPRGYRLTEVELVSDQGILATIRFRASRDRYFWLTEWLTPYDVADELVKEREFLAEVSFNERRFAIVSGTGDGEPMDGVPRQMKRRFIKWKTDGLLCEVGHVLDESPSLYQLLHVATSVEEHPLLPRPIAEA